MSSSSHPATAVCSSAASPAIDPFPEYVFHNLTSATNLVPGRSIDRTERLALVTRGPGLEGWCQR